MIVNGIPSTVVHLRKSARYTSFVQAVRTLRIFLFFTLLLEQVVQFEYVQSESGVAWQQIKSLPRYADDEKEQLLQLKLDKEDTMLLGSTGKGFVVWDFSERLPNEAIYLALPHGVRNITTKMMTSNSFMVSATLNYAVAGVR